jgi:hypothetical protein
MKKMFKNSAAMKAAKKNSATVPEASVDKGLVVEDAPEAAD